VYSLDVILKHEKGYVLVGDSSRPSLEVREVAGGRTERGNGGGVSVLGRVDEGGGGGVGGEGERIL
jgi:hypothetical protein